MSDLLGMFGRLLLLIYIQIRRLIPRRVKNGLLRAGRLLIPLSVRARLNTVHISASKLREEDGFRGMTVSFGVYFTEFFSLISWMRNDPCRPSLKLATIPTILKFLATFFQAACFAGIAGYLSLAANDWTLSYQEYSLSIPPTPQNTAIITVSILLAYASFAILNYIGGNLMLSVGLRYQQATVERGIVYYQAQAERSDNAEYFDQALLLSMVNTECRYLGRALLMMYNMVYQAIFSVIGFVALLRLDIFLALFCIAFILISLILQVGVIGKTLNDTRNMIRLSEPNVVKLRDTIDLISSSADAMSVSRDEIRRHLASAAVNDYDESYYDRLRIGLFASMIPQLTFAVFLAFFFGYSVYSVSANGINASIAVQYIFSLRFFLGGVSGILVGFVSIISFKPYFDNYFEMFAPNPGKVMEETLGLEAGQDVYEIAEDESELSIVQSGDLDLKLLRGQYIQVLINRGTISWLAISKILRNVLRVPEDKTLHLPSLAAIFQSSLRFNGEDPYESAGFQNRQEFLDKIMHEDVALLKTELDNVNELFVSIDETPEFAKKLWEKLTLTQIVCLNLIRIKDSESPIVVMHERCIRAIPERQRREALNTFLGHKFLVILGTAIPNFVLDPPAESYILLDKSGVMGSYDSEEIIQLPFEVVEAFEASTLSTLKSAPTLLDEQ